jgi:type I restriction enzyme S subunit
MIWEKVTLGELYTVHNGLSKGRKFFGAGDPFLSFSTVFNNYFIPDELVDLVQSDEKEQKNYSISRGDVFVTRTSETSDELGMSCVALKDYPRATYNGFTKRMRPIAIDRVLPEYIGYYMRMPSFRCKFQAFSTMTTRASLKNEDLLSLTISLPPMEQQIRIAEVLQTYDKLIENNQKQIKLLEEAAQRLYKEWFVDLHFPGYKDVELIDGIPKGWMRPAIGDIAEYLNGYAFKPSDWSNEGKPIIKIKEMKEGVTSSTPRNDGSNVPKHYNISAGDILFSWSATLTAMIWNSENSLLNQHIFKVVPKDGVCREFVFQSILKKLDEFRNLTTGSTMKHIQRGKLKEVFVNFPTNKVMNDYKSVAEPIRNNILNLQKQNILLEEARNRLLPKLMSGEIEV